MLSHAASEGELTATAPHVPTFTPVFVCHSRLSSLTCLLLLLTRGFSIPDNERGFHPI